MLGVTIWFLGLAKKTLHALLSRELEVYLLCPGLELLRLRRVLHCGELVLRRLGRSLLLNIFLIGFLVFMGFHDCIFGKLIEHSCHLVSDRVCNRIIYLGELARLDCVVGLHEHHLLELAALDLLLVRVTDALVDLLKLCLLLTGDLLLLLLAYLPLHRLLALLLQILGDDLVDTGGI